MEISTSNYKFTHGKAPRGYAVWVFRFNYSGKPSEELSHTGKYADAAKSARTYAVNHNASGIVLCS